MSKHEQIHPKIFLYAWVMLVIGIVMLVLSYFVWQQISYSVRVKKEYFLLLLAFIPLGGLRVLYLSLRSFYSVAKLGRLPMRLDPSPGSIGGDIGGVIECKKLINEPIEIVLNCMEVSWFGSGNHRRRNDSPKWQRNGYTRSQSTGMGSLLTFCFKDVPDDLPPTTEPNSSQYHYWMVELKLPKSVTPLAVSYKIPVQLSNTPSSAFNFDSSELPEMQSQRGIKAFLPFINDEQYEYGYFQYGLMDWVLTLMGSTFLGVGVFIAIQSLAEQSWMALPMYAMSAVFVLLGGLLALFGFLGLTTKTRITIADDYFTYQQKTLGFQRKNWQVFYKDIKQVVQESAGSSSNSRGSRTKYYRVIAEAKIDNRIRKIPLAKALKSSIAVDDVLSFYTEKIKAERNEN